MAAATDAKPSNRERIKEIVEGINDGIQKLFQSENYAEYLRTMSRFHNYSLNNTVLIHLQKPNASKCAGFRQWKERFGRHVKKGEKGITIIAPTPLKKKIEEEKLDPDTQLPMTDADGKTIMEVKTIEIPLFRPVKVFDVSQTEGKPLPEIVAPLTGDVQHYEAFMEALRRVSPVPVDFKPLAPNLDGFFSPERQNITLREGMSQTQTVCAAVHEIAHSVLHNMAAPQKENAALYQIAEICHTPALFSTGRIAEKDVPKSLFRYELRGGEDGKPNAVSERVKENFAGTVITSEPLAVPENGVLDLTVTDGPMLSSDRATIQAFQRKHGKGRKTEEVEAESVSYSVCQYFGIDTGANSFGYIASWSNGKELPELRASLETITKTSSYLITNIEKNFQEICKERGINLSETQETGEAAKGAETVKEEGTAPEKPPVSEVKAEPATAAPPSQETSLMPETPSPMPETMSPTTEASPATETLENTSAPPSEPAPEISEVADAPVANVEREADSVPEPGTAPQEPETPQSQDAKNGNATETPSQEPEQPDTVLDEYPAPDLSMPMNALTSVGYTDDDLLPLSLDRACELLEQDMTVYALEAGENPEMAFDAEELRERPEGTVFAVPREEWEESPDFQRAVDGRMERQEEREAAFLNHRSGDCLAIYQVRQDDELRNIRYEPLENLRRDGLTPERGNYDLAYTAPIPEGTGLEAIFKQFNVDQPPDYRHPSVSVSDILAINRNGEISCHYVDRMGFSEISGFLEKENALKNAELSVEDDANMIDGIINNGNKDAVSPPAAPNERGESPNAPDAPAISSGASAYQLVMVSVADLEAQVRAGHSISLMDLAAASHREAARSGQMRGKESILAKLHENPPERGRKPDAPKKSMERGL